MSLAITLIGGPTALLDIDGVSVVTDPTFDQPGAYQLPHVTLEKLTGPALRAATVGTVDAVLLSHDQHSDNLDRSGKEFLAKAARVLTTEAGARRLGRHAEGLAPWASTELSSATTAPRSRRMPPPIRPRPQPLRRPPPLRPFRQARPDVSSPRRI